MFGEIFNSEERRIRGAIFLRPKKKAAHCTAGMLGTRPMQSFKSAVYIVVADQLSRINMNSYWTLGSQGFSKTSTLNTYMDQNCSYFERFWKRSLLRNGSQIYYKNVRAVI